MKKEVVLSAILFAIGLGFFIGFRVAYQQIITAILGIIFIVLPVYVRALDVFQQLFKSKKQQKATV